MSAIEVAAPVPPAGGPPPGSTFWTRARVAEALGSAFGNALESAPKGEAPLGRIWTDTRSVQPGDCFVALVGERFDAHDFLAKAVEAGAHALVVSDASKAANLGVPVYVVPDTLVALGALANHRRRAWAKPVVGVIGSQGKTSTKELIKAALGSRLRVHATSGNFNNLVGVPLTLLALPDDADIAVVEIGTNQPGEIAKLRAIVEPDLVVVTSITEEHLEGLGDLAGVLREEMTGLDGVGVAIVPASQPEVVEAARGRAARVIPAGLEAGDLQATRWSVGADGRGVAEVEGVAVKPPLRGAHNLRNTMLALAAARECGISLEDAASGIAGMATPPMRVHFEQLGRATVINDAYNANPGSVRAALELLEHAGRGRQRVAVLGTMLELGGHAARLHDEIADAALALPLEVVAGVGEFARSLQDRSAALGDAARRVVVAGEVEALWAALAPRLAPDAIILLKGSRGVRLERLLPAIAAWAGVEPPAASAH